ncbi:MAG: cobalamin-binding protein [Pseudomonadota bacterium]
MRAWIALLVSLLMGSGSATAEPVCAPQADGTPFCLDQPARRVVSLAPHLTEMLFAIGVTPVGVVERSDYPPAARTLPPIGPYHSPDLERLMLLHPDLVVAWQSGTPSAQLERLRGLGLKVLVTRGQALDDIPRELRALGRLTGQEASAERAATAFERELDALTTQHAHVRTLSGFYEIWPKPLITISDAHFIGQAMARCGIRNIVGPAMGETPTWSEEAVLRARPELLLTSPPARDFDRWRRWKDLPAVQHDALIVLPPDVLMRPGPRLIEGIRALCAAADRHRQVQP